MEDDFSSALFVGKSTEKQTLIFEGEEDEYAAGGEDRNAGEPAFDETYENDEQGAQGEGEAADDDEEVEVILTMGGDTKASSTTLTTPNKVYVRPGVHIAKPTKTIGMYGNKGTPAPYSGTSNAPNIPNFKSAFDIDIDELEDQPWRKPGANLQDWFNYGFNEDTWREYSLKQKQIRSELRLQSKIQVYTDSPAGGVNVPPAFPQPPQLPPHPGMMPGPPPDEMLRGGPRRDGGRPGNFPPNFPPNARPRMGFGGPPPPGFEMGMGMGMPPPAADPRARFPPPHMMRPDVPGRHFDPRWGMRPMMAQDTMLDLVGEGGGGGGGGEVIELSQSVTPATSPEETSSSRSRDRDDRRDRDRDRESSSSRDRHRKDDERRKHDREDRSSRSSRKRRDSDGSQSPDDRHKRRK